MTLMLDDNFRPTRSLAALLAVYAAIQAAGIVVGAVVETVHTVRKTLVAPAARHEARALRTV